MWKNYNPLLHARMYNSTATAENSLTVPQKVVNTESPHEQFHSWYTVITLFLWFTLLHFEDTAFITN